jgi:hypothetical protein
MPLTFVGSIELGDHFAMISRLIVKRRALATLLLGFAEHCIL